MAKEKQTRRMIAMALAAAVTMSSVPVVAFAEDGSTTTTESSSFGPTGEGTQDSPTKSGTFTATVTVHQDGSSQESNSTTTNTSWSETNTETGETTSFTGTTTETTTITTSAPDANGNTAQTEETVAEGEETTTTSKNVDVTVEIVPGTTTSGRGGESGSETTGDLQQGEDDPNYDETTVTETEREVTVNTGEVETTLGSEGATVMESVSPSGNVGIYEEGNTLKVYTGDTGTTINPEYWSIDYGWYNGKMPEGWTAEKLDKDTAKFTYSPAEGQSVSWTVDWTKNQPVIVSAPEGDDEALEYVDDKFLLTGYGHWAAGSSGNRIGFNIIKENATTESLKHNSSLFALRDAEGNYYYAYCVDMDTDTKYYSWYEVDNLEDGTYYQDDDPTDDFVPEDHIRFIVKNGYWGTEAYDDTAEGEGDTSSEPATGSLESIKNNLSENLNTEATVKITVGGEEKEVSVAELISSLNEAEALAVTQAAIWTYSNGATREGEDKGGIVTGEFVNTWTAYTAEEKSLSEARMKLLYDFLKAGTDTKEAETVLDKDANFTDMSITVGDRIEHRVETDEEGNTVEKDLYEVSMNFALVVEADDKDNLIVTVVDNNGNELKSVRLAGEGDDGLEKIKPVNGVYTIDGMQVRENEDVSFSLHLKGVQHLEQGVYIYTAAEGQQETQTMVGLAEGTNSVDVTKKINMNIQVEDANVVVHRKWRNTVNEDPSFGGEDDPNPTPDPEDPNPTPDPEDPGMTIEDEDVPLADAPVEEEGMVLGAEDVAEEDPMVLGEEEIIAATGDSNHMATGFGGMLAALAGMFMLRKKKEN